MPKSIIPLSPFNGIFGLPPASHVSDEMIINSMPILEIVPCKPHFESGLTLFRIDPDEQKYLKILSNHGFSTDVPIRVAFLADNFPTDSFTNDYGETFLQQFTNVASQGMSQLAQITGAKTGLGGAENIAKAIIATGESLEGVIGTGVKAIGETGAGLARGLQGLKTQLTNSESQLAKSFGGGAEIVDKLLGGHRIDFPQVWRNSAFSPSYTATVRLYNPNPGSEESTKRHIIGPLAVFLCLTVPTSDDGKTYNWPFFHKIKAAGIYNLDPAVITNVSVIKGGDQQQIAYTKQLSIVDVRIDFTSLYTSLLAEEGTDTFTNRPTVRSYLKALDDRGDDFTKKAILDYNVALKAGVPAERTRLVSIARQEELELFAKNQAIGQRQAITNENATVQARSNPTKSSTTTTLIADQKAFYTTAST